MRSRMSRVEPGHLTRVLAELAEQSNAELEDDRIPEEDRSLHASLDMRYAGQAYELNVPLASLRPGKQDLEAAVAAFHDMHETRYGHGLDNELAEVVNVRLTARGATPKPLLDSDVLSSGEPEPRSMREVHTVDGGSSTIPVYHRDDLSPGQRLVTPSIVQQLDSTTYLPFGEARVHSTGSILVDLP